MKPERDTRKNELILVDVAKAAGVSKMTASRARVQAVAEKMGYRANPIVTLFHAAVHRRKSGYHATLGWVNDFPDRGHHRRTLYLRRVLRGAVALPVERRALRYAQKDHELVAPPRAQRTDSGRR